MSGSSTVLCLDPTAGSHIKNVVRDAIAMAGASGCRVQFLFNEIAVAVMGDTVADLVLRDFDRAMSGSIGPTIGPDYAAQLTTAEVQRDADVMAEAEARRAKAKAYYDAELAVRRATSDAEIAGSSMTMTAHGVQEWTAAIDANPGAGAYGTAAIDYAERWAKTMEARMAAGVSLAECWEQASDDADVYGLSGWQRSWATGLLIRTWSHGDELRQLGLRDRP